MRKLIITAAAACAVVMAAPPVAAGDDEDQQIADDAVLTVADLPEGWEEGDPDEDDPAEGLVPVCEGIERARNRGDDVPNAQSPDFDDTNDPNALRSVQNDVFIFPKVSGAKRFVKPFREDGEACLQGRAEEIPDATGIEVQELDVGGGVGYSVFVTVPNNGEEVTLVSDVVLVRVGRAITTFSGENVDEPIPEGPEILDTVIARLREADL
jgi:hypothetical protein